MMMMSRSMASDFVKDFKCIVQVNVLTTAISDTPFAWNVHFNSIPYATSSQASFLAYTILSPTLIYACSPNSTPSTLYLPINYIPHPSILYIFIHGASSKIFFPFNLTIYTKLCARYYFCHIMVYVVLIRRGNIT